ncbi:unnamed protein product, partial [Protopolystoma xenopodis]
MKMTDLLIKLGINLDLRNRSGKTVLHQHVCDADLDAVLRLLTLHADVNLPDV